MTFQYPRSITARKRSAGQLFSVRVLYSGNERKKKVPGVFSEGGGETGNGSRSGVCPFHLVRRGCGEKWAHLCLASWRDIQG